MKLSNKYDDRVIKDVLIYEDDCFKDSRGELWTTWVEGVIGIPFNHDKVSTSKQHVIRGLHGDRKSHKLVSCVHGRIMFVVADYRENSPTYLKTDTYFLSNHSKEFLLLPPGIANGFLVYSALAVFNYKWSYEGAYPDVEDQFTLRWDDPKLGISWPINPKDIIMSDRDKNAVLI